MRSRRAWTRTLLHSRSGAGDERRETAALPDDGRLMAQLILNGPHRELLWKLTTGWPPPTLPADNLEDPAEHLLSIRLAEVVDGKLWATQAGYDLRARIEREEL
jgi:hypothetical protein